MRLRVKVREEEDGHDREDVMLFMFVKVIPTYQDAMSAILTGE
jgi:hypothetical protein